MILKQLEIGPLQNFIYFIGDERSGQVAVVDPAWDVDLLRDTAQKNGWTITDIFLTHGHPDHVNGIEELQKTHDIPVHISRHEAEFFVPSCKNFKMVEKGQTLKIGSIEFKCLHTPGHSPGCQCFLSSGNLIAGDTIFIDGCGRCDLPGSDPKAMYRSLYDVVMKLPDATEIYPGHNYGPSPHSSLAGQKKTNPYLNCGSMEEFLQHRMGVSL